MSHTPGMPQEPGEESAANAPDTIPNGTIYSYNMGDSENPGGLKVRWKVKVVTGPDAARLDALQNEAIRELLLWARQYRNQAR